MKDLVYLSTARTLLADNILLDILKSARKNNAALNVTGVLLYSEGTFIQALEGSDEDVDTIFKKIKNDVRHKNIIVIAEREISKRNFPEWFMGFTSANKEDVDGLIHSLNQSNDLMSNRNKDATIEMLKTFIESNNLSIRH